MLNYIDSEPTIRNAIIRRLDAELGIRVLEIKIKDHKSHIKVGVQVTIGSPLSDCTGATLRSPIQAISRFDLPPQFDHIHLVNEIDEMCEQFKNARLDYWKKGGEMALGPNGMRTVPGTGLRGRWPKVANG